MAKVAVERVIDGFVMLGNQRGCTEQAVFTQLGAGRARLQVRSFHGGELRLK
ncbi:hypothetical protein D3C81_2059880 [compost metagenome]